MDQDIPVAERLQPITQGKAAPRRGGWAIALVLVGLMGVGAVWFLNRATESPTATETEPTLTPTENLLGHLPYEEAPLSELEPVSADGQIKLRRAAAERFRAMVAAAQQEGVVLVPLSGFRSKQDQDYLFFEVKEQRAQRASERALVSAPPGYSEHHTGYAIDIGDGARPDTHLSEAFEDTPAFRWLEKNAARFSFELSFPRHNPQGVSYEPWHWRFVGDRHSLQTFYRARQLTPRNEP
ncbi:D-alanyl-D-alanine carboxypeptidase family protein [Thermosynechococcus sp. B0]|uniref:M15 family metallopeptidase n=1 Tax=unclassified Thermosynechococcus TaxID=2622553 RepID=UPI002575DD5B|nr:MULTISPECIES: M15 family metallopeptidase [unclassified Thermosynechococcus]WJI24329.1 D-alanyl-D-alanine carboxypeptidase family protein [Thermosynechococcus sp. B0]WJI26848.1 D-alanyl-D-alanine carboxypeptidase family protein [Thermosynechococcus sp. B1]WJI29380.1 D-alanyl-D-alanine carboxypeptidase family protein [Thermosynechococcus sp. B3]